MAGFGVGDALTGVPTWTACSSSRIENADCSCICRPDRTERTVERVWTAETPAITTQVEEGVGADMSQK